LISTPSAEARAQPASYCPFRRAAGVAILLGVIGYDQAHLGGRHSVADLLIFSALVPRS
jgi:hypothetical protein